MIDLLDSDTNEYETNTGIREELSFSTEIDYSCVHPPEQTSWQLPVLYQFNAQGNEVLWQIGWNMSQLVILFGRCGGALQTDMRSVETNTSGRTLEQQALQEAKFRYKKKYDEGYRPRVDSLMSSLLPKAMLANEYSKDKSKLVFPVIVQPKLDGKRILAHMLDHNNVGLRSRSGKSQCNFQRVRDELAKFFTYLPAGCHLDGELYKHGVRFESLSSIFSKKTEVHPRENELTYYIFDIIVPDRITSLSYLERYTLIVNSFNAMLSDGINPSNIQILQGALATSHEDVKKYHDECVQNLFEGAMLKKLNHGVKSAMMKDSIYKPSRCNNMLKVKNFISEEGIIVEVVQGTGREEGLAIFKLQDVRGNVFPVRPSGTFDQRRVWYENSSRLIGQQYTFRYFELGVNGVPRFPTGITFRNYE
uniref:ATP-dependent DNA ligase family profile domain-containing protein n=1 Tax=viral metagenome TaxID=1070528 RepID=A0A6C0BP56_9ZZZZ